MKYFISPPDFYNAYLYKKANEHCYNITKQMSSNFFDVEDKDALLQILVRGSKEDIIKYILDRFCKDIPNILNDYMHKNEEINEKMMTTANEMANICTQKRSLLGL